jgi:outer membrane receptor protein involved in Fe transport
MSKTHEGGARRRRSLFLAGAAMLGGLAAFSAMCAPAFAQTEEGEIVVTGSRLRRPDLSAPSPTTVLGAEAIENAGDTTMEAVLNELPQLVASNGTSTVNSPGGSGVLEANLRGLGATRTLVLVDGRRFIPTNEDGSVDLASIPAALISRVDVITGGASAVYGSDAIAGAVNFILRDDVDGVEFAAQWGQADAGDATTEKFDLTIGADFAEGKGNVIVHGNYTNRDPVMFANRDFSAIALQELNGELVPFGSSNIPGMRIALSTGALASLVNVDLTASPCGTLSGIRFGEGGEVLPFCQPEDAYNFAPDNYLLRPLEREQLVGLATYEIAPDVEAYMQTFYINSRNAFQQAPDSFAAVTPGRSPTGLYIPNYATNPILPEPVRQLLIDNPHIWDTDGNGEALIVSTGRRAPETGVRHNDFERSSLAATGGLRGDLHFGERVFSWDVFGQYMRSRLDQSTEGVISQTRLSLGLDAVLNAQGQVVCRTQVLGCVPVNPFGIDSITPEAAAFIATTRTLKTQFERSVVGATITGELFDLPGGAVSVAGGVEYRQDEYAAAPGATDLAREYGAASVRPLSGGYDVSEVFGEVRIPILQDAPFADSLAIELAGRRSDYSNFGEADTYKIAGEWAPVEWLRFRTAYNKALRAPTVGELFSPVQTGFTAGDDPCDVDQAPSAAEQQLCVEQGVPAADIDTFQQINVGFSIESGGNPNLQPEESETITYGFVFRAPFVEALNVTVDYYEITVDQAITAIAAQQVLNTCFASLDNGSAACQAITRSVDGQIDFVSASNNNIAALEAKGVDAQIDYTMDLPDALALGGEGATLRLALLGSWKLDHTSQIVGSALVDCLGRFGGGCSGQGVPMIPDYKGVYSATYVGGPLTLTGQVRYLPQMELRPGVNSSIQELDAIYYFDLAGTFRLGESVELFGGVDNLTDEQPPLMGFSFAGDPNTDPSFYDVIGRRFFIGARARF